MLASHKDYDKLADFEFVEGIGGAGQNPLACKMRAAAIRQHVLFYGLEDTAATTCKRAAAIFKTNYSPDMKIADVCEQIGFKACVGICRHGGSPIVQDDGTCKSCKCPGGWGGQYCTECTMQEVECFNGGKLVKGDDRCECECKYPFTGVHCEQCNRRCANGGFADPADKRCQCQCETPWGGEECGTCALDCKHGGNRTIQNVTKTRQSCECECPALAEGPECEKCTARCLNGGVLDQESCTCECAGGFTGDQCEICDVECKYGSTFFKDTCSCYCTNPWTAGAECEDCSNTCHGRGVEANCTCSDCEGFWDGLACDSCTLQCMNGGALNAKSCKCSCDVSKCKNGQVGSDCSCVCDGFWRGEECDTCNLNCVHGKLNAADCMCECEGFFTGDRCDECDKDCEGRGLLDKDRCICDDCIRPWYGFDCAENCTKNCYHGSFLDSDRCICDQCILPWMGPDCDTCKLLIDNYGEQPCVNGEFDADNCTCVCEEGWGGELCDQCIIQCEHGVVNASTCSCECERFWNGTYCDECVLECENGGVVEPEMCYCQCDKLHSGTFCQGGQCDVQIACDSCLSVSDGCEWCGQTSTCGQKPAPNETSQCEGPNRTGICPVYGECHVCDYTSDELEWLSLNGHASHGAPLSSMGGMDSPEEDAVPVCTAPGTKWCARYMKCTNLPCPVSKVMVGEEKIGEKRSRVGSMIPEKSVFDMNAKMNAKPVDTEAEGDVVQ